MFVRFENLTDVESYSTSDVEEACQEIHDRFTKSVKDRMDADAPTGISFIRWS
ncbi:hypothetical protein [Butyrivibrio sp. AE2032]|uniref:hypothetical protein n=1 Tax=Butyrivibrio sp. AE2032 TaxID=1458463 RepID=UPI000B1384BE|nr:hypothetical protein [Butyrivibrio sp. AE2032]